MHAPEFEIKYLLRQPDVPVTLAWLRARYRAQREHAMNRVFSLYFDTPGGDLLDAKANGDFHKLKVRLRWYALDGSDAVRSPVFLEVKRRTGATRTKTRVVTGLAPLPEVRAPDTHAMRRLVAEFRPRLGLPAGLEPVLGVSYRRHRFVAPSDGTRVNLDDEVRAIWRAPRHSCRSGPALVDVAVLEAKGPTRAAPSDLVPLLRRVARRASFSKYHALLVC